MYNIYMICLNKIFKIKIQLSLLENREESRVQKPDACHINDMTTVLNETRYAWHIDGAED